MNLIGNDYRLFQNTIAWDLAKAVEDNNLEEIEKIYNREKSILNFQEPIYGQTLLMMSINNCHYSSFKKLLELGADPNIHDFNNGASAIIYASEMRYYKGDNSSFLKLLLKYHANPNDEEIGERKVGNDTRKTPLIAACTVAGIDSIDLRKVQILADAGADINKMNDYQVCPLNYSLLTGKYDVAYYLLKKGANYEIPIFQRADSEPGYKTVCILDFLRERLHPLNSIEHNYKLKIIEFLKFRGLDYWSYPIPVYIIERIKETHPQDWREYLERY